MILIYDNSVEGLLTAVFEAFKMKSADTEIISQKQFIQQSLFETSYVVSDETKANRVWNTLNTKISSDFAKDVYCLYLADTATCGTIALNYVRAGIMYGKSVYRYNIEGAVNTAIILKNKVLFENHRFKGFVRFRNFKNVFLSDIRPDYNILPLLYKHFDRRLPNQDWIIRDLTHDFAAMHFDGTTQLCPCIAAPVEITDKYEDVWCAFYKSIAIKERKNPKLQRAYMPKRYWNTIIETACINN